MDDKRNFQWGGGPSTLFSGSRSVTQYKINGPQKGSIYFRAGKGVDSSPVTAYGVSKTAPAVTIAAQPSAAATAAPTTAESFRIASQPPVRAPVTASPTGKPDIRNENGGGSKRSAAFFI